MQTSLCPTWLGTAALIAELTSLCTRAPHSLHAGLSRQRNLWALRVWLHWISSESSLLAGAEQAEDVVAQAASAAEAAKSSPSESQAAWQSTAAPANGAGSAPDRGPGQPSTSYAPSR